MSESNKKSSPASSKEPVILEIVEEIVEDAKETPPKKREKPEPQKMQGAPSKMLKSLWLYCEILSLHEVILPCFSSELGWDYDYLHGVLEGDIDVPLCTEVEHVVAEYAFTDDMLFRVLKETQTIYNEDNRRQVDFGYHMCCMPDTQYMLDMISLLANGNEKCYHQKYKEENEFTYLT